MLYTFLLLSKMQIGTGPNVKRILEHLSIIEPTELLYDRKILENPLFTLL